MAEAILAHLGDSRFEVFSAGSNPAGFVHQLPIDVTQRMGVPMNFAESKSWDQFKDETFNAVITLCDAAAGQECPVWPGEPIAAHWSLQDPTYHPGTIEERLDFAMAIGKRLTCKIEGLIAMDWSADRSTLKTALDRLGDI